MAEKLADAIVYLAAENAQLKRDLQAAESDTRGWSSRVGGLMTTAIAGIGVAAAGAVVAVGTAAVNVSQEVDAASKSLQSQLGLTADEAQNFEQVMRDIYTGNFGDSYQDVADGLAAVALQFERIGAPQNLQQLQNVTETAFAIQDAFGVDMEDAVAAVTTLMEQFGISSEEAFNFVVGGFQRGLNSSDDFLDSIGEYSNQFAFIGADAGEFFSILETGLQAGVLGTDKISDAFKEFGIRVLDTSDSTIDALNLVGIKYSDLTQQFEDGSLTISEAAQIVLTRIAEIEDPIERNIAGVALFGTQWEDLTETVMLSVDLHQTRLRDLEGSTESLNAQYETLGNTWETANRKLRDSLVPVGDALGAILMELLPPLTAFIDNQLVPALEDLADIIERLRSLSPGEILSRELERQRGISLGERWQNAVEAYRPQVNLGGWVGGGFERSIGANSTTVNVNMNGSGTYEDGRAVGSGVVDALRARGAQ